LAGFVVGQTVNGEQDLIPQVTSLTPRTGKGLLVRSPESPKDLRTTVGHSPQPITQLPPSERARISNSSLWAGTGVVTGLTLAGWLGFHQFRRHRAQRAAAQISNLTAFGYETTLQALRSIFKPEFENFKPPESLEGSFLIPFTLLPEIEDALEAKLPDPEPPYHRFVVNLRVESLIRGEMLGLDFTLTELEASGKVIATFRLPSTGGLYQLEPRPASQSLRSLYDDYNRSLARASHLAVLLRDASAPYQMSEPIAGLTPEDLAPERDPEFGGVEAILNDLPCEDQLTQRAPLSP
jgi:hypothetical protein